MISTGATDKVAQATGDTIKQLQNKCLHINPPGGCCKAVSAPAGATKDYRRQRIITINNVNSERMKQSLLRRREPTQHLPQYDAQNGRSPPTTSQNAVRSAIEGLQQSREGTWVVPNAYLTPTPTIIRNTKDEYKKRLVHTNHPKKRYKIGSALAWATKTGRRQYRRISIRMNLRQLQQPVICNLDPRAHASPNKSPTWKIDTHIVTDRPAQRYRKRPLVTRERLDDREVVLLKGPHQQQIPKNKCTEDWRHINHTRGVAKPGPPWLGQSRLAGDNALQILPDRNQTIKNNRC